MVSFNRVVLAGNLTRDPELRFTQEGVPVANFSIAVNRVRSKSEAVDFFNVSCWRELGERVANYKKKGDPIVNLPGFIGGSVNGLRPVVVGGVHCIRCSRLLRTLLVERRRSDGGCDGC
jgi:hypothetical protein